MELTIKGVFFHRQENKIGVSEIVIVQKHSTGINEYLIADPLEISQNVVGDEFGMEVTLKAKLRRCNAFMNLYLVSIIKDDEMTFTVQSKMNDSGKEGVPF